MEFLRGWRSKLSEANESLATAHKSWRDEKLVEREQRATARERTLDERETEVARQLGVIRAMEARRWRRRVGLLLTAVAAGTVGFLLGGIDSGLPEAESGTPLSAAVPSDGIRPQPTNVGPSADSTADLEQVARQEIEQIGEVTSATCVRLGIAWFKEIGSYPTLRAAPEAGRQADVVAEERCARTRRAFGPWGQG